MGINTRDQLRRKIIKIVIGSRESSKNKMVQCVVMDVLQCFMPIHRKNIKTIREVKFYVE